MELRHVHIVCLARAVTSRPAVSRLDAMALGLVFLLIARGVMAALLPLSADEAYYWLWSKHLDAGYFDHPPAIAFLIRAGTQLFGDSPAGVRAAGLLLSLPATWFVWQSAQALLGDRARALLAALFFNLTLMVGAEMLAATPDMPSIVTACAYLFCLAKLQQSEDGRWWLAAGVAAGLGLLSKYSALFLGAGTLVWLVANPRARAWLVTIWPWAGAVLAGLIFLPNLLWQASHHWETFVFQFGRVAQGQLTARYLVEFIGAQFGLATPFIFLLGCAGLLRVRRDDPPFLLTALMLPALLFFLIHALHERVQGNWTCFLFAPFAILAADAGSDKGWRSWCAKLAIPAAAIMLCAVYVQALTSILPLGNKDPIARLLGAGFREAAGNLPGAIKAESASAILTTDYETTAWLRFYVPGLKVIQLGEIYRYPNAPSVQDLKGSFLYLVEKKRDQSAQLRRYFSAVTPVTHNSAELSDYEIWRVSGQTAPAPGKTP